MSPPLRATLEPGWFQFGRMVLVPGFMANYVFILEQVGQRLASSRVTGAGKAAQPVSGFENKCLQYLVVLELNTFYLFSF